LNGGTTLLDRIKMTLRDIRTGSLLPVYIDVHDNSLSRKWLLALNNILRNDLMLEKNYCFFGFASGARNTELITQEINRVNCVQLIKRISDIKLTTTLQLKIHYNQALLVTGKPGLKLIQEKFNQLHRYFEDLQGVSGRMSPYYDKADAITRYHIRQLNLLCHEYESLALSIRKKEYLPEWQRPSQLMCWLHAPRFILDEEDFELFGIESLARPLGGVFIGVNKAVGKHHWEVFQDEGRDSRLDELTTTTLRSQTEAAGDFDIEWANDPGKFEFMQKSMQDFREWLILNGFDPEDKTLTIGHPQVGQVDLIASFGTTSYQN
jgi:hypothetical protein